MTEVEELQQLLDNLESQVEHVKDKLQAICTHSNVKSATYRCNDEWDATAWFQTSNRCLDCNKLWTSEAFK